MGTDDLKNKTDNINYGSAIELQTRAVMRELHDGCPIPPEQFLENLGLFLESKNLSRILFMNHLYKQIVDVQGVVMEFGTRWGQNGALFSALRGIYEPFNRHRRIVLFDTFTGFPGLSKEDGESGLMQVGQLSTTENYEEYLDKIMSAHEGVNPLNHIKKYEIRKGDGIAQLDQYFKDHPETIVSLAYFDFDIYEPTKRCIDMIAPRLTKGSIVGFDELNDPDSPGETLALMETFGIRNVRLKRFPYASRVSYFVVE